MPATLEDLLQPLREAPERSAVLLDVDGVLAPIVEQPDDAHMPETTRRRDGFMFPVNSDYDLFSLGPDGRTAVSLGSQLGKDDILRANNGGYLGPASAY